MYAPNKVVTVLAGACAALTLVFLTSCGGGASTDSSVGGIGGTGYKGPVVGATVTAYALSNGAMGTAIGNASTDAHGNFNLKVGSHAGAVMLQLSGGSYTDEATGTNMLMASGDVMTAALPPMAAGATVSGVQLTPLTSMAQTLAQHLVGGMTDANIAAANTALGNYFSVSDILHTVPMNPLVSGSGAGASQDAMNYGMTLAAMTQYAKTLGMNASSAMVTAMMSDAADGVMDGKSNGTVVMMGGMGMGMGMPANAGTTGLATAMQTFMGSGFNKSGLTATDMAALIQKLNTSNGRMQ